MGSIGCKLNLNLHTQELAEKININILILVQPYFSNNTS